MKLALLLVLAVLLVVCGYWGILFYKKVQVSKQLVKNALAFQNLSSDRSMTLLVLGDSTGVGVGAARPEESIAGLLSKELGATYTENKAVSGAGVADLEAQIAAAQLQHYDTVLVQIGANDIVRFRGAQESATQLGIALKNLETRSGRTIVLMAGDLGGVEIFPPPLRPLYTRLTLEYHAAFAAAAESHGASYINLYTPSQKDLFQKEPSRYFAADRFHPSSAGYLLWFERLKTAL